MTALINNQPAGRAPAGDREREETPMPIRERGNWIQTMPGKGWFTILRLYSPLPSFLDKSWRPSEIELVKLILCQ